MNITNKKLPRGQAELTVELNPEEFQPFVLQAAGEISARTTIPGFRPGKAPYAMIKERVGEGKIWEQALEPAVKKTYVQALQESGITSVGAPKVDVLTLVPGNAVSYRATVNVLPEVTLPALQQVRVTRRAVTISDAEVQQTLQDARKLRRTERLVDRPAQSTDKVEIKLQTLWEGVPVEHGSADRLPIVLGEGRFLPGFEEQLIGLRAEQEKTFTLKLPETYHNRTVAGKVAEFRVKVLGVYELTLPALTDDFAKSLGGFASLQDLQTKVRQTLQREAEARQDNRLENEILDQLIAQSRFTDIPDVLVTGETKTMLAELERSVTKNGIAFATYLREIKKSRAELLLDFTPQAIKRVKGALISRAVAEQQQIAASDADVDAAIAQEFAAYDYDAEARAKTREPAFRAHVKTLLVSRKVMEYLKKTVVQETV